MKKYVVLKQGEGLGCDYTIDCNKSFYIIEAETEEEAKKKFLKEEFENVIDDKESFNKLTLENLIKEIIKYYDKETLEKIKDEYDNYFNIEYQVYEITKEIDIKLNIENEINKKTTITKKEIDERKLYNELKEKYEK